MILDGPVCPSVLILHTRIQLPKALLLVHHNNVHLHLPCAKCSCRWHSNLRCTVKAEERNQAAEKSTLKLASWQHVPLAQQETSAGAAVTSVSQLMVIFERMGADQPPKKASTVSDARPQSAESNLCKQTSHEIITNSKTRDSREERCVPNSKYGPELEIDHDVVMETDCACVAEETVEKEVRDAQTRENIPKTTVTPQIEVPVELPSAGPTFEGSSPSISSPLKRARASSVVEAALEMAHGGEPGSYLA